MLNMLARSVGRLQPSIVRAAVALPSPGILGCVGAGPARRFNSSASIVEPVPANHSHVLSPEAPAASSATPSTFGSALPVSQGQRPAVAALPTSSGASLAELLPLLAAQPSHYITLHIHGKPYLVTPGDSIRLPFKMPGVLPGDVLRFDRASVIGSRDFTLKGSPWVSPGLFECRAVVIGTDSEPMRLKIKKKQRERKTKTVKSKHKYTVLRVSELKIITPETTAEASTS